jgi:hypothetical protein
MGAAMSCATSAADTASEEARKERVELGHPILGHINRDLLVIGWGCA